MIRYIALAVSSGLLTLALDDNSSIESQSVWLIVRVSTTDSGSTYTVRARAESQSVANDLVATLNEGISA